MLSLDTCVQEISLKDLLPKINVDIDLDLRWPSLPRIPLPKLPRVSLNLERLLRRLKVGLKQLFDLFDVDLGDLFGWFNINLGDFWVSDNTRPRTIEYKLPMIN